MEITWHGNKCFTLKGKKGTIVIDPSKDAGKLKGDIVLKSSEGEDIEVEGAEKVFDWPGEYEIKDIPIVGFQAWTVAKSQEEDAGSGDSTIIFYFKMEKIKVCHLGSLGHSLGSDIIKQIEDVDVLMIDTGKGSNLGLKKGMEIIEAIDPRVVIPMGEGEHTDFIKELGAEKQETEAKFSITAGALPEDSRECVILKKA